MDPIELAIRYHVTEADVVFDVGANEGLYTRMLTSLCREVIAFEPLAHYARALTELELTDLRVVAAAVSDAEGEAEFFIDTRPEWGGVASSLMELTDLKAAGQIRPITVPTVTLDGFCAESGLIPKFVKIDVEGCEPQVFAGALKLIAEHAPVLLFEYWENHYLRYRPWFERLSESYRLVRVGDGAEVLATYTEPLSGGADILAIPKRWPAAA